MNICLGLGMGGTEVVGVPLAPPAAPMMTSSLYPTVYFSGMTPVPAGAG